MISNRTRIARLFDFEVTCMISDQIAVYSIQLPLLILVLKLSPDLVAEHLNLQSDGSALLGAFGFFPSLPGPTAISSSLNFVARY